MFFRLFALTVLLAGLVLPASAQISQSTSATANLNIRQGPGTQFAVIGQIPRGQWVNAFGCTNPVAWCQVVHGNLQGWVSATYLSPRPTVVMQTPPQVLPGSPMPPPLFPDPTVPGGFVVTGFLTNEGFECPTLRSDDGNLYTLVGNLGVFRPGDRVRIRGPIPQAQPCRQGTTIRVTSIERAF